MNAVHTQSRNSFSTIAITPFLKGVADRLPSDDSALIRVYQNPTKGASSNGHIRIVNRGVCLVFVSTKTTFLELFYIA